MTLRKILVHPKDKVKRKEVSECVYKIPCKNCDKVYIGETGRPFVTRLNEHKKEVELKEKTKFTRQRKQSVDEQQNKSAITDHVVKENHVIGWDEGREGNRSARWIRESIEIRKQDIQGHTMNRDAGTYTLSHLYDALFSATVTSCGENRNLCHQAV